MLSNGHNGRCNTLVEFCSLPFRTRALLDATVNQTRDVCACVATGRRLQTACIPFLRIFGQFSYQFSFLRLSSSVVILCLTHNTQTTFGMKLKPSLSAILYNFFSYFSFSYSHHNGTLICPTLFVQFQSNRVNIHVFFFFIFKWPLQSYYRIIYLYFYSSFIQIFPSFLVSLTPSDRFGWQWIVIRARLSMIFFIVLFFVVVVVVARWFYSNLEPFALTHTQRNSDSVFVILLTVCLLNEDFIFIWQHLFFIS